MIKIAILVLVTTYSFAATFEFVGACSRTPIFAGELKVDGVTDAGTATIKILNDGNIPYAGSKSGMKSIKDSPTGLDAMEIISDLEMYAHGWCYSVNGVEPSVYPDEVEIKDGDHITWWYGYAHYLEGKWLSMCEPTWKRAPSQFCDL